MRFNLSMKEEDFELLYEYCLQRGLKVTDGARLALKLFASGVLPVPRDLRELTLKSSYGKCDSQMKFNQKQLQKQLQTETQAKK